MSSGISSWAHEVIISPYQFYVWKYLGYKIVNINGRETTKDKIVCKICVNDVSYMTGTDI
jgi:hypothetical protein